MNCNTKLRVCQVLMPDWVETELGNQKQYLQAVEQSGGRATVNVDFDKRCSVHDPPLHFAEEETTTLPSVRRRPLPLLPG
jgi:hypothetical protein